MKYFTSLSLCLPTILTSILVSKLNLIFQKQEAEKAPCTIWYNSQHYFIVCKLCFVKLHTYKYISMLDESKTGILNFLVMVEPSVWTSGSLKVKWSSVCSKRYCSKSGDILSPLLPNLYSTLVWYVKNVLGFLYVL